MTEKSLWRRLYEWDPIGPGKFLNPQTYTGHIRAFLVFAVCTYVGWHFDDIYAWEKALRGEPYQINPAKQSWARLWAVILGGGGMLVSLVGIVLLPFQRRRLRDSKEDPSVSARDASSEQTLESAPAAEHKTAPTTPQPETYWQEESTPTSRIVEPPEPRPGLRPLRVDKGDGRATLVVHLPDAAGQTKPE